jgi:hypothetical protein
MFSLKNGKAEKKNKFASQHIFGPNIALFKKKYLAVHIITDINYYENSTKAVN